MASRRRSQRRRKPQRNIQRRAVQPQRAGGPQSPRRVMMDNIGGGFGGGFMGGTPQMGQNKPPPPPGSVNVGQPSPWGGGRGGPASGVRGEPFGGPDDGRPILQPPTGQPPQPRGWGFGQLGLDQQTRQQAKNYLRQYGYDGQMFRDDMGGEMGGFTGEYEGGMLKPGTGLRSGDPMNWWLRMAEQDPAFAQRVPPPVGFNRGGMEQSPQMQAWWQQVRSDPAYAALQQAEDTRRQEGVLQGLAQRRPPPAGMQWGVGPNGTGQYPVGTPGVQFAQAPGAIQPGGPGGMQQAPPSIFYNPELGYAQPPVVYQQTVPQPAVPQRTQVPPRQAQPPAPAPAPARKPPPPMPFGAGGPPMRGAPPGNPTQAPVLRRGPGQAGGSSSPFNSAPQPTARPSAQRQGGAPRPEVLGLPNDPRIMRGEMEANAQLAKTLLDLGIARDQIPYLIAQMKARMETDSDIRERRTNEAMIDRGVLNSSIASRAQFEGAIPEQRQWADYLTEMQSRMGELSQAEMDAHAEYQKYLENLYYDQAASLYEEPPSSVFSGNQKKKKKKKGKGKKRRRRSA